MHFLFRADASLTTGTGHVVRCATLAAHLVKTGHDIQFLCRETVGNLIGWLESQGMPVLRLAQHDGAAEPETADAQASKAAIGNTRYDWLVVDHYDLGDRWEKDMASQADRVMAIDDLGRHHDCDLLVDQNYPNPIHQMYQAAASAKCVLLLGPEFALVRPEFTKLRSHSLARQRDKLSKVLVFMGGSDPLNETSKALNGIALAGISDLAIDVVIGGNNPHRSVVEAAYGRLPSAQLHVQTQQMADLLASADCAIGAGGSTTWERCVLGVPALVTILADNQEPIAVVVAAAGAHRVLGWHDAITAKDYADALRMLDGEKLRRMSEVAASLCDGMGVARIAFHLSEQPEPSIRSKTLHA